MTNTPYRTDKLIQELYKTNGSQPTPSRRGYKATCPLCRQHEGLSLVDVDGCAELVCPCNCDPAAVLAVLKNPADMVGVDMYNTAPVGPEPHMVQAGRDTTSTALMASNDAPLPTQEPESDLTESTKEDTASKAFMASNDGQLEMADPWPDPLHDEARYGLAGDIVATIEPHSEADPVGVLIQLLIAFGNLIGRSAFFRAEADRHYGNLFGCLVGITSKGRKGTSWGQASQLLGGIDPNWHRDRVLGGLSSGEGLIWAVRDPESKRQPVYEGKGTAKRIVSYEDVVVDAGVDDRRLTVVEGEFSAVLKVAARERNTLSAVIRQAWDKGTLRILTKNAPAKATDAHISIIGHITRDELRRLITETDLANGMANRFLWLCVRRSKCLPEGGALHEVNLAPLF